MQVRLDPDTPSDWGTFQFSEATDENGDPALVVMSVASALAYVGGPLIYGENETEAGWAHHAAREIVRLYGRCSFRDPGCAGGLDPDDQDACGLEACRPCLDRAEMSNEHSDYGHDSPVAGCPDCPTTEGK